MKITGFSAVIATASIAGAVWAHSGATGVVKERMDGMMAMGKSVKDITPMMRGQTEYDPERIRAFAEEVRQHSGEAMTKLFPEGSDGTPSEAKPSIWADWDEFEALAEQLHTLSEGLALAAENGPLHGGGGQAAGMMGGQSMMSGRSMMGSGSMMGGSATSEIRYLGLEELSEMPADGVFMMVSQTCSACHTKFRAEAK
jgi:cytochrome c556